jgi:hypothetical protein
MPGPAKDERLAVDMDRSEVERILHKRPSTLVENHGMVEARYEYADGPPAWSVLRSLVYVAGDVFTFFLSELIFWPIELYADDEIKRVAVAEYSEDDKLAAWSVRRASSGKTPVSQKSPKYDRYAAEAKSPSPLSENMYARLPAVSESPPAVWTGQDVISAPESVTTERDTVEFEVLIKNTDRYTRLLVDGRPVAPAPDGTVMVTRAAPPGQSNIILTAIDESGEGFSRVVKVMRSSPNRKAPPSLRFGRYHALVIGNNEYSALPMLATAAGDARAVADVLREHYGFEVELLIDARRAEIVSALSRYRSRLGPEENLLVYYAGHGIRDEGEDHGYWLPVDAEPNDPAHWIANAQITRQIKAIPAKHVIVVADSCFSGTLLRGIRVPDRGPDYLTRLAARRSRTALTSGGIEPVSDVGSGTNSVFAHAFIQELLANDGLLEANELFMRLSRRVALQAEQSPQYAPIVSAGHEDGEFLFVAR